MGKELGPEEYDTRLERVMIPYEDSPWRKIYDTVVELLPTDQNAKLLDIGCGTGRCAEAIRQAGYKNYVGFDFSPKRIAEAQRYVPEFEFRLLDVFSAEAIELIGQSDVIILTEVLEHISKDKDVITHIPAQKTAIISVPNYDSKGHVRVFESVVAIEKRYSDLIEIDSQAIHIIPSTKRPQNKIFVFRSTRKGKASV